MSSILPRAHRIDRNRFVQLVLLSLCLSLALIRVGAAPITGPNRIEVFTVGPMEVTVPAAARLGLPPGTELQVYRLDGIKRIQAILSRDLPIDPENAKRVVLQRIQQLAASDRAGYSTPQWDWRRRCSMASIAIRPLCLTAIWRSTV